jgi:hypothetical protein
MSRHLSLAAFFATIAVIVPVAWHSSDATIETEGKSFRPLQQAFTVDGVRVTVDVDRSVITTGDTVTATLHAYADTTKSVAVDLTVLKSVDEPGERVSPPPRAIDHEKLALTASSDGGKGVTTRLRLGSHTRHAARIDRFMIYVAPHGKKTPTSDDTGGPDYAGQVGKGRAAGFGVLGWSGDSLRLAIVPEGPITPDAPFTIDVHVTNTSGRDLPEPPVFDLGTKLSLDASVNAGDDFDIEPVPAPDQGSDDDSAPHPFAKGAEVIQKYTVTPHTKGVDHVTFVAGAYAWPDDPGAILAGAMDIHTFAIGAKVAAK